MKHSVKFFGVAVLSLGLVVGSEAMTLGRASGAVLIGQPLNVVVPVQLDAGESAASLCFDADVFHADARQDASRVRVVVEAAAQPQMANARVLSSVLVDEPVVTVYLRTGCGPKTTRRYVLLADLASEVAAAAVPVVGLPSAPKPVPVVVPVKPVVSQDAPIVSVTEKSAQPAKSSVARKADIKRPETKAVAAAPRSAAAAEKSIAGRPAGQSRLKLESLELFSDRIADLDSFMTFPPPEDALRNNQKVQTLERDVKALLALAAKNEASLIDLKGRLQLAEAQAQHFPAWVVYTLMALVLACLAAVAWLWSRQRRRQEGGVVDWWHGSVATDATVASETGSLPPPEPMTARPEPKVVPVPEVPRASPLSGFFYESRPSSGVDVNVAEMSDSHFGDFMPPAAAQSEEQKPPPAPLPGADVPAGSALSFNSEAVLDIRQQAEFFVSLGQTDMGERLLKKHINESDVPNPFVYLDLFSLFHSLSQKVDFQQLREDFHRRFNVRVAEFALFRDEGRDLESYPDVVSRISALWPQPQILRILEASIFPAPRDTGSPPFDLAAFRDLLLLHGVAQMVLEPQSEGSRLKGAWRAAAVAPDSPPYESFDMLDLDLSSSDYERPAPKPASVADFELPFEMFEDQGVGGKNGDATRPLASGK